MFNGPIKSAKSNKVLFHSIMNKCCWKMLRRSLTTFDSPSNNNFRLRRYRINYGENIKQQQLFGNIFKRMYNDEVICENITTADREETTSLVIANNKKRAMISKTSLHEEFYEYSDGCKPHNINELWYYYMEQKRNFLNNIPIYLHLTLLTNLYEKKEMEKVLIVINYLRGRENVFKWFNKNLMILEYIIKLNVEEAIKKFKLLNIMKGTLPIRAISNLIESLVRSDEIIAAEELFGKVEKEYGDVEIYNTMMNGYTKYVKEQKLEKTLYLLEMMQRNGIKPNLKTYNLLLNLFGKIKAQDEAERIFGDMIEVGIKPDASSYHGVILSCAKNKDVEGCFYYFNHMIKNGINPNIYHYSTMMSACVKSKYAREAIKLYSKMINVSMIKPNVVILTTLMCALVQLKYHNYNNLDQVFEDIKRYDVPDLIAYTALINAKTKQMKLEEAILVYQQMLIDNIKPNVYTYTTLIDASAKLRNLETALKLFDDMKKKGIPPNQFTYCAIMSAYINNDQLQDAFRVFEEMKQNGLKPDVTCFNCLMDACNRYKSMPLLFRLYSDLIKKYDLTPDNGTISIYLDACTFNNYFNIGKKFYGNFIRNNFPFSVVKLNNQNYLSIINFLRRSGQPGEFIKVLNIMKKRFVRPSIYLRLIVLSHLYELNRKKDIEAVHRILEGWCLIPTKYDLIKFKRNCQW